MKKFLTRLLRKMLVLLEGEPEAKEEYQPPEISEGRKKYLAQLVKRY